MTTSAFQCCPLPVEIVRIAGHYHILSQILRSLIYVDVSEVDVG